MKTALATFMRPDLLVCPGCRSIAPGRFDLRTLAAAGGGDFLACACGLRYPIVDGVPIVLADPAAFLRDSIAAVVERDLAPELAEALALPGPDDAPYARMLEHISIYMDAHWGDRAEPAVEAAAGAIVDRLSRLPRVPLAVELGCSAGRIVGELAARAEHVVGVELQFATLRRARHVLDGEPVAYARRVSGRHYMAARARTAALANHTLVCGDALDPPLVPGAYRRVVALNVLDAVARPRQLLSVMDSLCAPEGELILSSPYTWQSDVVDDRERFGGADPAAALVALLTAGEGLRARYEIVEEADLPWVLRREARSQVSYRIHYLRARRVGSGEARPAKAV